MINSQVHTDQIKEYFITTRVNFLSTLQMLITEQKACKSVHWRIDVEFKFGSSLPAPGRRRHWSRRIGNRGCVMCGSGYYFFVWFFISWSVCENEIYNPDPSTKSRSSRNLLLQHIRFLLLFLVIWNEDFWVSRRDVGGFLYNLPKKFWDFF